MDNSRQQLYLLLVLVVLVGVVLVQLVQLLLELTVLVGEVADPSGTPQEEMVAQVASF